ncbi:2-oxo acid dehydrogenase subunit E2 [Rhodococcus sp. ABRD24]|uniref:dihydrolipoamide acetyltransferase family protein n=1 Tax=Rhodococcus sp. ABRD24 TaxID=2507582 RepID=UPI00103E7DB3|nr:dihydrolipoamide acetyltransferase family protein [Rhodococcus sp. ABRD24]QBJ97912.1 2-oxo acid dehydrogenase subunit E2 [Rhodococcus sp. ABRD24]
MSAVEEFRLPDLGEGLTEAELVSWAVAVGDTVALNQAIGEVETAKAVVELPSPYAGVVRELLAQPGDTVPVGAPVIRIETADPQLSGGGERRTESVLVGYGPSAPAPSRRRRPPPVPPRTPRQRPDAVRRHQESAPSPAPTALPEPGDRETRTPIRSVRRQTASAMVRSAFTAPQVTEFLTADVTESVRLLAQLRASARFEGLHLTPLILVAKALLLALRVHPELNSAWLEDSQEIVTRRYVNLGIATATDRGLVVPTVRDAEKLSLPELARAIADLTATARDGKATPEQLSGGTITITNVGIYGVDAGTPILNPGEAAILALGAINRRPWVLGDELAIREVTTLSLTVDHRLVDGEQASRFLADLAAILIDPVPALLAQA